MQSGGQVSAIAHYSQSRAVSGVSSGKEIGHKQPSLAHHGGWPDRSLSDRVLLSVGLVIPVNSSSVDFGVGQSDLNLGKALASVVCKDKGQAEKTAITAPGPAGAEWTRLRENICLGSEARIWRQPDGKEIGVGGHQKAGKSYSR